MRLTISATVWLAMAAVGFFVVRSQRQIGHRAARVSTFEQQADDVTDVLARMRAAQQAYVAEGQSTDFWTSEVTSLVAAGDAGIEALHSSATDPATTALLDEVTARLAGFADTDARAREYLRGHQLFMASDVVFAEGGEAASMAAKHLHAASLQERQAFATFEAGQRRFQAMALGGVTALAALALAVFALASGASRPPLTDVDSLSIAATPAAIPNSGLIALKEAATICTEFGRAGSADALAASLGKAAVALQARGLIVWVGDEAGEDLRPLLAHGYSAQMLARMPVIPRSADNAAAAAYRTGRAQVVTASGDASGAVVTPLLTPTGCVGALTTEVAGGEETSDHVQALAAVFAAQLATLVAPAGTASESAATRTASA